MALTGKRPATGVPTMPTGVEVASYATYLEAQKAVDHLSDQTFPVQHVTIVGTDLRMVERVTGRLTYPRVAGAGAMTGAWFGLLISLLLWLFSPEGQFPILAGVLMGAAFGILAAIVSYALTGGKRDFTSASQVVASRYAVLCEPEHAAEASRILTTGGFGGRVRTPGERPGVGSAGGAPGTDQAGSTTQWASPGAPSAGSPPRYGVNLPPQEPASRPPAGDSEPAGGEEQGRERPRYGLRLEDLEDDHRRQIEEEQARRAQEQRPRQQGGADAAGEASPPA